ncbi:peptidase [Natrinema versiforme]|uniref:Peptidase n=1 Tax=Natrinema versiforme TaxID=88724 RepID=A0A4V1FYG4_9EURY|nr:peptidase [Natrinema versiforme]QCS41315.1 peptidase [Natrinema versiforme]
MIGVLVRWLGLLVVGYIAGRLYGRLAIRRRGTDGQGSRGTYRFLAVVGIAALLVLTFSGLIDATETALSSVHPILGSGLATPLAWAPAAAGTIVAILVAYLGVFPSARERRGLEISASTAVARLGKYLVAVAIFCLGLLAPFTALLGASNPSPLLIPVVFAVLAIGVYAWLQYSIRLTQDISDPTAEQRRRLETAADRADLTATVAGVFSGRETETAGLYLDGPFWNRQLYATDYAFDVLGDEELAALCARERAADDLRLLERRSLVVAVLFGLFLTVTVWTSVLVALVGLAVTWPLLVWHLQHCEFAADRRAAREIGAGPLASAYEAHPDLTDSRGRLHERLASTPSTARRLERLRESG